jgi:hypothetical protein
MSQQLLKPLALVLSVSAGTILVVGGYVQALRTPDLVHSRPIVAPGTHESGTLEPGPGDPAEPAGCMSLVAPGADGSGWVG